MREDLAPTDREHERRERERAERRETWADSKGWIPTEQQKTDTSLTNLEHQRRDTRRPTYYGGNATPLGPVLCPRCAYWPCECREEA